MGMKLRYNLFFIQLVITFCFDNLHDVAALLGQHVVPVEPNELPFVASLAYDNDVFTPANNHFCTGILISGRFVLTAKHCAETLSNREPRGVIYLGCPSLQACKKYRWESWTSYGTWAAINNRPVDPVHDEIAVVKLTEKVENIQAAVLRSFPGTHATASSGAKLYMAGWGHWDNGIIPNNMQAASVKVLSTEECKKKADKFVPLGFYNWKRKICTQTDAQSGYAILSREDTGGPIYDEERRVVGINIGVCPDASMPPRVRVNLHETFTFYKDFLSNYQQYV